MQRIDAGGKGNLERIWSLREHRGNDLLVLFRFKRASGVDDAAAGADCAQCGAKNGALALGLADRDLRVKAVADLGIAAQRAGAAAWDVGEGEVEGGVLIERCGVGEAALDPGAERGKALAQLIERAALDSQATIWAFGLRWPG